MLDRDSKEELSTRALKNEIHDVGMEATISMAVMKKQTAQLQIRAHISIPAATDDFFVAKWHEEGMRTLTSPAQFRHMVPSASCKF